MLLKTEYKVYLTQSHVAGPPGNGANTVDGSALLVALLFADQWRWWFQQIT